MVKTRRNLLAFLLIFVGFIALITPFTPGSFLIIVGLAMLFPNNKLLKKPMEILEKFLKKK